MGGKAPVPEGQIVEMLELWRGGMSAAQIAEQMGLHANTVYKHIENVLRESETSDKTQRAKEMFESGATIMQVVHECEISSNRAKQIRDLWLGPKRPSPEDVALRVWRMFSKGTAPSRIDVELGISNSREIIVYEWRMDRLKRPSLVGSRL